MAGKWATLPRERQQPILMGPSLDEQIAPDDPIRLLDEILLGLDWTEWECFYSSSAAGRPPVHPRLMAGAILYGMINRIRSSRDLETATRMRVDFHWLLGCLSVDHSTFARFRNCFGDRLETLLKDLNKEACKVMKAGPKRIAVDGTRMRANSDRHGARTAKCLQAKIESLQSEFGEIMAEMDMLDAMDALDTASVAALEERKAGLDRQREKLEAALEVARGRDEAKRGKDGQGALAVRVPVTDPDSSLLPNKDGGYAPNYTATAAVDVDSGLVVDADVAIGGDEASAIQPAVEAAEETFGHKPDQVLCDSGFVTGGNLEYLADEGVEAFAPTEAARDGNPVMRPDPTKPVGGEELDRLLNSKGKIGKAVFFYDDDADVYHCPMGRELPFHRVVKRRMKGGGKTTVREYRCGDCSGC
ncbi:MAG: transposase, partial [Lentisphaeria bacterium]|nr:transposase [Lentisphaeria bacterium]